MWLTFFASKEQSGLCLRYLGPAGTSGQGTEGVQPRGLSGGSHHLSQYSYFVKKEQSRTAGQMRNDLDSLR